jgi:hypothetical protein
MKIVRDKFKWGDGGSIRNIIEAKKLAVCGEPPAKGAKGGRAKKPKAEKPAAPTSDSK